MRATDLDRLEKVAEGLALLFYVLMFVALVMALAGSAGSGFWLLIVGSCAHVGQAALVEFVERERAPGGDTRPESRTRPELRARPERAAQRARTPRTPQRLERPVRAASSVRDSAASRSAGSPARQSNVVSN